MAYYISSIVCFPSPPSPQVIHSPYIHSVCSAQYTGLWGLAMTWVRDSSGLYRITDGIKQGGVIAPWRPVRPDMDSQQSTVICDSQVKSGVCEDESNNRLTVTMAVLFTICFNGLLGRLTVSGHSLCK